MPIIPYTIINNLNNALDNYYSNTFFQRFFYGTPEAIGKLQQIVNSLTPKQTDLTSRQFHDLIWAIADYFTNPDGTVRPVVYNRPKDACEGCFLQITLQFFNVMPESSITFHQLVRNLIALKCELDRDILIQIKGFGETEPDSKKYYVILFGRIGLDTETVRTWHEYFDKSTMKPSPQTIEGREDFLFSLKFLHRYRLLNLETYSLIVKSYTPPAPRSYVVGSWIPKTYYYLNPLAQAFGIIEKSESSFTYPVTDAISFLFRQIPVEDPVQALHHLKSLTIALVDFAQQGINLTEESQLLELMHANPFYMQDIAKLHALFSQTTSDKGELLRKISLRIDEYISLGLSHEQYVKLEKYKIPRKEFFESRDENVSRHFAYYRDLIATKISESESILNLYLRRLSEAQKAAIVNHRMTYQQVIKLGEPQLEEAIKLHRREQRYALVVGAQTHQITSSGATLGDRLSDIGGRVPSIIKTIGKFI